MRETPWQHSTVYLSSILTHHMTKEHIILIHETSTPTCGAMVLAGNARSNIWDAKHAAWLKMIFCKFHFGQKNVAWILRLRNSFASKLAIRIQVGGTAVRAGSTRAQLRVVHGPRKSACAAAPGCEARDFGRAFLSDEMNQWRIIRMMSLMMNDRWLGNEREEWRRSRWRSRWKGNTFETCLKKISKHAWNRMCQSWLKSTFSQVPCPPLVLGSAQAGFWRRILDDKAPFWQVFSWGGCCNAAQIVSTNFLVELMLRARKSIEALSRFVWIGNSPGFYLFWNQNIWWSRP